MWLYVCILVVIIIVLKHLQHLPWVKGLHKKCVFITGCDTGFGNALAKSLYAKGVYVFAGCYTEKGADDLGAETGDRLKTVMIDVACTDSIQRAYDFVQKSLPDNTVLWGVVNNAGINSHVSPLEFFTRNDLQRVMNINCFGMVEVARIFLPLIKKSKGRIVNTASLAGMVTLPCYHPYLMSKFALRAFSEALRYEKSVWGIKVATICPGGYKTNILNSKDLYDRANEIWERADPKLQAEYGEEYRILLRDGMLSDVVKYANPDLSAVIAADEHALFARYPHKIYYPGIDAKIVSFVYNWLPWLHQLLITNMYVICRIKPEALKN